MAVPDANFVTGLPTGVQIAINVGIFAVAAVASAYSFWSRFIGQKGIGAAGLQSIPAPPDAEKTALTLAVTRLAIAAEILIELLRDQVKEGEIEREVQRRSRHDNDPPNFHFRDPKPRDDR